MHAIDERPATSDSTLTPRNRPYGSIVLGLVLVAAGALWLLDALDVFEVRAALVLPILLGIVGLALVVGSFDGPHSGLVVFGVFLTVAVVLAAVFPPNAFAGGIGERNYRITTQEELEPAYNVGMGAITLDLTDLSLTESTSVDVTVGAGEMLIRLPADVAVAVDASAGAGDVNLLGEQADGISVSRVYESPDYDTAEVTLTLDLNVAAGEIEVTR
ncbi:MAG TPA: LiaF domain-containing protein [Acidimicrobiia bacterium]|nr:LiaF domain-containing protein [Acidimicrobiia bacterium]